MDTREVVPDGIERDHMGVVFELLGEGIGEPGEPAHVHPHGEVVPLNVGCRNVVPIRVAIDLGLLGSGAFGGTVAAFRAIG